jgi:hypothetical protein
MTSPQATLLIRQLFIWCTGCVGAPTARVQISILRSSRRKSFHARFRDGQSVSNEISTWSHTMKSEIRMALLLLASTAAPALAQGVTPQCAALFDTSQNSFTASNAAGGTPNAQCFLTVMPKDGQYSDASFPQLSQYPAPQLQEGTYEIQLSGGGGGGGGGADSGDRKSAAAGSDGSGALHSSSTQYLAPGIYKLTIGTGGRGGASGNVDSSGNGDLSGAGGQDGNPTAVTRAYTNETVAGFPGADVWNGGLSQNMSASAGSGNASTRAAGGPGSGGEAGYKSDQHGQSGDQGGAGFVSLRPIQLAQATPVRPAPAAAPAYVAPAPAYVEPAPAYVAPAYVAPAYVAPAPVYVAPERARRQDRN